MSSPNPEEIAKIRSNPDPRTNPARYEDPAPEDKKAVTPETVVVLGPNPTYIVDTTIPAKLDEIVPPIPPAAGDPVLSSVEPNELPVWAQDTEVFWNGSNFTEASRIIWNDGEEPTKFISAQKLSTIVKPSTVQASPPFVVQTYVTDNGKETSKLDFTFIA